MKNNELLNEKAQLPFHFLASPPLGGEAQRCMLSHAAFYRTKVYLP